MTNRIELLTARAAKHTEAANAAFTPEGFVSKAAQKRVLEDLNRAFGYAREARFEEICAAAPAGNNEGRQEFFDSNDLPFDLHQVRAKHEAAAGTYWAQFCMLADYREVVRNTPVIVATKTVDPVKALEKKVQESVADLIKRRMGQYNEALRLNDIFGTLPVTVSPHYVHGHKGTNFVRCFYFLNGKLTPLNVILAAMEKIADDKKAAKA